MLRLRYSRSLPLHWTLALSPTDQESCARDLTEAARAALSTGNPARATAELTSWRETAASLAAGPGSADVERLDEAYPVERP